MSLSNQILVFCANIKKLMISNITVNLPGDHPHLPKWPLRIYSRKMAIKYVLCNFKRCIFLVPHHADWVQQEGLRFIGRAERDLKQKNSQTILRIGEHQKDICIADTKSKEKNTSETWDSYWTHNKNTRWSPSKMPSKWWGNRDWHAREMTFPITWKLGDKYETK